MAESLAPADNTQQLEVIRDLKPTLETVLTPGQHNSSLPRLSNNFTQKYGKRTLNKNWMQVPVFELPKGRWN